MAIGIDPTVDFAFKRVLGSPEHPAITLHFLNAVLGGDPLVTQVEILNPFLEKDFDEDKLAILDVRATDEHGQWLNIEMQTTVTGELPPRLTYYAASQFVGQLREGESYEELRPSIGICVIGGGLLFPDQPELHLDFRLRGRLPHLQLTDMLQIHLLELPKYAPPSDTEQITDPIEQWAYFFRSAENASGDEITRYLTDAPFTEATGVLEMIARNPRERELYEARLKLQRDQEMRLRAAREEGLAEGRAEGRAEGEAKGRVKLLQQLVGVDVSSDEALSGLSIEELSALEGDLQRRLRERGIG